MENNTQNITIGQAIDLVIKNADNRLGLLESQMVGLLDVVNAIAKKLNYGELPVLTQKTQQDKSDAEILAEMNGTPMPKQEVTARLTPDKIHTEPTTVDWQIRISGQMGTCLNLAKYEYEELMDIINSNVALPYADKKWTISSMHNDYFRIEKLAKDGKKYFCIV